MIKKIIHFADFHLRTYKMHDEYREICKDGMDDMKKQIVGLNPDEVRIVMAGDFVHQKITISNEQLMLGCWFLRELANIAPVIIIAGNHDLLENNKDRLDSISPMIELLNNSNITYLKESKCYLDDNIVWCNYSIFEENARPNIEMGRIQYGDDKTYVGLFHGPVIGAKTDIGYEFEHGTSLDHFEGCDMVCMGDIHLRSHFTYNGIPISFSSSFIQQNFGEKVGGHGYLLWDVATRICSEHDIQTNYGFYQFKIKGIEAIENNKEILTNK